MSLHRIRRVAVLAAVIASRSSSIAHALDPRADIDQHIHRRWTDVDGLPSVTIHALAQTGDGYLWIGTSEGLVRFDGVAFKVFDRRTTPALRSNVIQALHVGRDGTLWIGTLAGGLVTRRDDRFETVARVDGTVLSFAETAGGAIWVGTDDGAIEPATGRRTPSDLGGRVRALAVDADGSVWIGGGVDGLVRWDGTRVTRFGREHGIGATVTALVLAPNGDLLVGHSSGASIRRLDGGFAPITGIDRPVCAFAIDPAGAVWLGTQGLGVVRSHRDRSDRDAGDAGTDVCAVVLDREGNVFYGGVGGGLRELSDSRVQTIDRRHGLGDAIVLAILEDAAGAIWIGTNAGGLYRWSGNELAKLSDLPTESVRSLAELDGRLWVGTAVGLVWRNGDRFGSVGALDGQAVSALLPDRDGSLWVGTVERGLFRMRGEQVAPVVGLDAGKIWALAQDRDGTVWVSTGSGLVELRGDRITRYGPAQGLDASLVLSIHPDSRGDLWLGTMGHGLVRRRRGAFAAITSAHGLPSDDVLQILEIDDDLWMSSNRGLSRASLAGLDAVADRATSRVAVRVIDRKDGMTSADCTLGGQPAGWRTRDGALWFPTASGAVRIDPRRIPINPHPPQVDIETLDVDGRSVEPRSSFVLASGTRRVRIDYTGISLSVPDRVTFHVRLEGFDEMWIDAGVRRSASYTNLPPGDYAFVVRAVNADGVASEPRELVAFSVDPALHETIWFWVLCGIGLAATFSTVYLLGVRRLRRREARLQALVSEQTESLRAAVEDRARAERMASVATLVRGVAHELNNPVAYIAGNIDPLRRYTTFLVRVATELSANPNRDPAEIAALIRFSANKDLAFVAGDLARLMEDVEDGARRARLIVGDLQELTARPRRGVEQIDLGKAIRRTITLLAPKTPPGVTVHADIGDDLPQIEAGAGQLEQVLVNLIDNAILAVGTSGNVWIAAHAAGDMVTLVVRDDGCGMTDAVRRRALDPFFTTRGPGEGSGLGLAIVASIIGDHDGTIEIASAPGGGTTITVGVPKVRRHRPSLPSMV